MSSGELGKGAGEGLCQARIVLRSLSIKELEPDKVNAVGHSGCESDNQNCSGPIREVKLNGETYRLCRYHAKHSFGVSS